MTESAQWGRFSENKGNTKREKVEELAKLKKELREEIAEKGEEAQIKENAKAIEVLIKFKLIRSEKELYEEGMEKLLNYWLKFRIDQGKYDWQVEILKNA